MKRSLPIRFALVLLILSPLSKGDSQDSSQTEPASITSVGTLAGIGHLCWKCDEIKDASAFTASWLRKKGKLCRDCKAGFNKRWYEANKSEHMEDVQRNTERYRRRNGALLLQLKSEPCVDCGATLHPFAMDFDHVRGVKDSEISQVIKRGFSLKRFMAEVAKCELVCANCHRIRTAQRMEASGKRVYWNR